MKLNKMVFDDKKIEEAARLDDKEYYDRLSDNDRCFFEYGFRRGYNRALKDLWHPASEIPSEGKPLIVEYTPLGNFCDWEKYCKAVKNNELVRRNNHIDDDKIVH